MSQLFTADQVRAFLRAECEDAGSQKAWAATHGLSTAHVADVLGGRREPAAAILAALGLHRVVFFEPNEEKDE